MKVFDEYQFYWKKWYRLPWWVIYSADEYGPKELWGGVGPFQFRKYLWRTK